MGLMNLFKKKKPWVRFYSVMPGVSDLHPWIPARKLHRPWRTNAIKENYKSETRCPVMRVKSAWERSVAEINNSILDQPGYFNHAVTCPAITSVMDSGYVMVCPADIIINLDGSGINFDWVSQQVFGRNNSYVKAHIPDQTEGMRHLVDQNKEVLDYTIKMETPWRVQSHPDLVFIQMPIPYWDEDRFTPPTGIVDPSYSFEVNLQLFWHKIEEGTYCIKAGTPLCQWVPISRKLLNQRNVEMICETQNEWDIENNDIMEYQRHKSFMELDNLKDRIKAHKVILALNKNIKRFM